MSEIVSRFSWLRWLWISILTTLVAAFAHPAMVQWAWAKRLSLPRQNVTYRGSSTMRCYVSSKSLRYLMGAYMTRMAVLLPLLFLALTWVAVLTVSGYSSGCFPRGGPLPGGPSITLASPLDYLPIVVGCAIVIFLHAPTMRRVLGPCHQPFREWLRRVGATSTINLAVVQALPATSSCRQIEPCVESR